MTDSTSLVPRNALQDVAVGISVSDSADLGRLGLASEHCDLAVAEIARAVLVAGGSLVYGGRLFPTGFTQILIDEVSRFADDRDALTICLPASEHSSMSVGELGRFQDDQHSSISLVCLDQDGEPIDPNRRDADVIIDIPMALSGMRRHVTSVTNARVVVGGQLSGQQGSLPGILEETLFGLEFHRPVYVAGGFGGAAAAIAQAAGFDDGAWAPANYPAHADDWAEILKRIRELANQGAVDDGLTDQQRGQLAVTHRAADIAAIVVLGLARSKGNATSF
jgi:hypothetical protein